MVTPKLLICYLIRGKMKQRGLFEEFSGSPLLLGRTNLGPDRAWLERKYAPLWYKRTDLANLVSYIGNKNPSPPRKYRCLEEALQLAIANNISAKSLKGAQNENH